MATLRLQSAESYHPGHGGEIFGCAYSPESTTVITGGWDGKLRLWDAASGAHLGEFAVGNKPVSACAVAPDGKNWLAGTMEGMLVQWDVEKRAATQRFMPHTRPISCIAHAPDGNALVTTSWDRNVRWSPVEKNSEPKVLGQHADIVAGAAFAPDGQKLYTWSYDRTIAVWDVPQQRLHAQLRGHGDRILSGAVSHDGRCLATGGRDRCLKLWDLQAGREMHAITLKSEICGLFFLLDNEALLAVDANGRVTLHLFPSLELVSELRVEATVQCARLAPSGAQLALGGVEGRLHRIAIDGFDARPLAVTAMRSTRATANMMQRLFGLHSALTVYSCRCPACCAPIELLRELPNTPTACPSCRRSLRVCTVTQAPATAAV